MFSFLFLAGFAHRNNPQSIDLNAVRLCFQVFLEGTQRGKFTLALKPVVSEPIFDKSNYHSLLFFKEVHGKMFLHIYTNFFSIIPFRGHVRFNDM